MDDFRHVDSQYVICAALDMDQTFVLYYWADLWAANLIDARFPLGHGDTVEALVEECATANHFYVYDLEAQMIRAEFQLDNLLGKAAQIHFSMHPINTAKLNAALADSVTDTILLKWPDPSQVGSPFLETLYGLTPTLNKPACRFALRAGMKRIGILPSGAFFDGVICDALVTMKTRV